MAKKGKHSGRPQKISKHQGKKKKKTVQYALKIRKHTTKQMKNWWVETGINVCDSKKSTEGNVMHTEKLNQF